MYVCGICIFYEHLFTDLQLHFYIQMQFVEMYWNALAEQLNWNKSAVTVLKII